MSAQDAQGVRKGVRKELRTIMITPDVRRRRSSRKKPLVVTPNKKPLLQQEGSEARIVPQRPEYYKDLNPDISRIIGDYKVDREILPTFLWHVGDRKRAAAADIAPFLKRQKTHMRTRELRMQDLQERIEEGDQVTVNKKKLKYVELANTKGMKRITVLESRLNRLGSDIASIERFLDSGAEFLDSA